MRTYTQPRRGYCASCEDLIAGKPVYRMDETYCCIGCAQGGPCMCTYESDMADDGVDRLGLPFAMTEQVSPLDKREPDGQKPEPTTHMHDIPEYVR
jgi:hypothetical protein